MTEPRYDGFADWYDAYVMSEGRLGDFHVLASELLRRFLGHGGGRRLLDLGCGGGHLIPEHVADGWRVTGVDVSADMLRIASERAGGVAEALVQADAAALPFDDGSFDAVASAFTHTDADDFAAFCREGVRVLSPGGRFAYVGTHPCFTGPFAELRPDLTRIVYPGYRDARWHADGPGLSPEGIRALVGTRHVPLAELLNAVIDAGLVLERVEEGGARPVPELFGFVAVRRGDE